MDSTDDDGFALAASELLRPTTSGPSVATREKLDGVVSSFDDALAEGQCCAAFSNLTCAVTSSFESVFSLSRFEKFLSSSRVRRTHYKPKASRVLRVLR